MTTEQIATERRPFPRFQVRHLASAGGGPVEGGVWEEDKIERCGVVVVGCVDVTAIQVVDLEAVGDLFDGQTHFRMF